MWIVIAGSPIDGITIWGPFACISDADEWAEDQLNNTGGDYWISQLTHPDQE